MFQRLVYLTLGMCVACSVGSEDAATDDDDALEASTALAAADASSTYTRAEIDAKLFGYLFADGNFYTDEAVHPVNPSYFGAGGVAANDMIKLACKGGYVVKHDNVAVSCADPPTSGGSVTIMGFRYPHGANLDAMTGMKELHAFFSGLLIGEGSRAGQVDDQFPNIPAGHYTTAAEVITHISLVQHALGRAGFTTAHLTGKSGAQCSGLACREVWIDVKTEGCKFAAANGYTFVSWRRVPGAIEKNGGYVGPAPCS